MGKVMVKDADKGISLEYDFGGLEPSVVGGWHIHTGKSCSLASSVGGHYYKTANDPWLVIKYKSDNNGKATGNEVMSDFTLDEVSGRAVVVHAQDGKRVGCGQLLSTPEDSKEMMYVLAGVVGTIIIFTLCVLLYCTHYHSKRVVPS